MSLKSFASALSRLVPLTTEQRSRVEMLPFHARHIGRHADVISRFEMPTYFYVNLEGWAGRYLLRKDGRRRITGFLLPGDFCGIHAACQAEMDHSITAFTDCRFAIISMRDIEDLERGDADIGRALSRAKLVEEATLRVWLLNFADAYRSLAHLICEIDARVGQSAPTGGRDVAFPITQEVLADALGLTAVHVNRTMRSLSAEGLIKQERHSLHIPDVEALRKAAEFNPGYLMPFKGEIPVERAAPH